MPPALGLGHRANEPWQGPRCVLVIDEDLFIVERSRLWIDSLHIQMVNTQAKAPSPVALWTAYAGQMYVSNTVVQGSGIEGGEGTCVLADKAVGGIFARGTMLNPALIQLIDSIAGVCQTTLRQWSIRGG